MNFPNILSLSRIILLLPIIFLFENSFYYLCFTTFVAASITDYLDGYLARKNNLTSDVGALLDLLADKLFVCILLIWMTYTFKSNFLLLSSILIISREITVSYLRTYLVSKFKNINDVKADSLGKLKTSIQMISLAFILISPKFSDLFFTFSEILLFVSAALSWISIIKYFKSWNEK